MQNFKSYSLILILSFTLFSCKQVTYKSDPKSEAQLRFLEKRIGLIEQRIERLEAKAESVEIKEEESGEEKAVLKDVIFSYDDTVLDDPLLGSSKPEYLLVVYIDLLCDTCRDFLRLSLPEIKENITIHEGFQLRLRDYPLNTRPLSKKASHAAHCAGEAGKYWQFLELLSGREISSEEHLLELLGLIPGIDAAQVASCFNSDRYSREIDLDKASAQDIGVTGVPSIFIGSKISDSSFSGFLIRGNQDVGVYLHYLEKLITLRQSPNK